MRLLGSRHKALYLGMALIFILSFRGIYLSPIQQASPGKGNVKVFLPIILRPAQNFLPILFGPPAKTIFGAYLDVPGGDNGLAMMAAAGASWVRTGISWSQVEPSLGQYNWTSVAGLEKRLEAVSNSFMNSILFIDDTPRWALKSRLFLRGGIPG